MTLHPALSAFLLEVRRPALWACLVLCVLGGALAVTPGVGGLSANGPVALAESLAVMALFGLALPQALLPQDQGADGARFTAATTAAALAFSGVPVGMALAGWRAGESLPAGDLAMALALLGWPTLLLACALAFAGARLTGSALAGRLAVAGLAAWWLGVQAFLVGPDCRGTGALADPSGLRALAEATRYWSAQERESLPLPLEGSFLLNRLLWLGVAVAAVLLPLALERLRLRAVSPRR